MKPERRKVRCEKRRGQLKVGGGSTEVHGVGGGQSRRYENGDGV